MPVARAPAPRHARRYQARQQVAAARREAAAAAAAAHVGGCGRIIRQRRDEQGHSLRKRLAPARSVADAAAREPAPPGRHAATVGLARGELGREQGVQGRPGKALMMRLDSGVHIHTRRRSRV